MRKLRCVLLQRGLLLCTQAARDLDNAIALAGRAYPFEFVQQHCCECAAAGTKLKYLGSAHRHDVSDLACQGAAKQGREFRRSDEITVSPELCGPSAVVTQLRRVKHKLHVACKRNRAAGRKDFRTHTGTQRCARSTGVGIGYRQMDRVAQGRAGRHSKIGILPAVCSAWPCKATLAGLAPRFSEADRRPPAPPAAGTSSPTSRGTTAAGR